MSTTFDDSNRQVIPRWLDYRMSCALRLLDAAEPGRSPLVVFHSRPEKSEDWRISPTLVTASDLVVEGLLLGADEDGHAQDAAQFILKNAPQSALLLRDLATSVLQRQDAPGQIQSPSSLYQRGRPGAVMLKRTVRASPFNPIAWSDLSLWYAMQGCHDKAGRAMTTALALAPHNRFILRNASRCFLHMGDPERAVLVLRQSGACASDPWLAAAEIAISEGSEIRSAYLKHGRSLLVDNNLSPFARSELAAALSTIEAKTGASRKTRALIQQTLLDPSENALAQIEWLATQRHTLAPPPSVLPGSFEAQARHLHRAKQFAESLSATENWIRFQPFSSRPLIMATFLASVCLNDDSRALRIASAAARGSVRDPLLLNNIAFAHARQDDVPAAIEALNMINPSDLNKHQILTVAATHGLVLFRSGREAEGRELYARAVQSFDSLAEIRSAAIASFFWAFEEKRIGSPHSAARIADAKKRITRASVFELENAAVQL